MKLLLASHAKKQQQTVLSSNSVIVNFLRRHLPFSRPLLKTLTSFKFIPRPVLMDTASVASFLWPRLIDPFA